MRHLLVMAIAAITVSGCAGGGGDAASPGSKPLTRQQREALVNAAASPDQQAQRRYRTKHDQMVTQCMKDAGFPGFTVPADQWEDGESGDSVPDGQNGFGISTNMLMYVPRAKTKPSGYYLGLSPEKQHAYDQTFLECSEKADGGLAADRPGAGTLTGDRSRQGAGDKSDSMVEIYLDIDRRTSADPRVAVRINRWSSCMTGQGYSYARIDDMKAELQKRATPFIEEVKAKAEARGSTGSAALTLDEIFDKTRLAELAALQSLERKLAVAHVGCGGEALIKFREQIYQEILRKRANGTD